MKIPTLSMPYCINSSAVSIIKATSLSSISKGGQQLLLIMIHAQMLSLKCVLGIQKYYLNTIFTIKVTDALLLKHLKNIEKVLYTNYYLCLEVNFFKNFGIYFLSE